MADKVVKAMPDGLRGFCKVWGWQQFARELLDVCGMREGSIVAEGDGDEGSTPKGQEPGHEVTRPTNSRGE